MPILKNYTEFDGRHYETGTLRNVLAYQGAIAPHTGKPISEALLLGLSGGIVFGYFTFEYKGYDPQVNLLSRNTFDPFETMLERLGVPQNVAQSANLSKGQENLMDRDAYAEFLDEAAALLYKTKLESAAHFFRQSAGLWRGLAKQMLPDDAPLLKQARTLLDKRYTLFIDKGDKGLAEIEKGNARLNELRDNADKEFPWDEQEYATRRAQWCEALLQIKQCGRTSRERDAGGTCLKETPFPSLCLTETGFLFIVGARAWRDAR